MANTFFLEIIASDHKFYAGELKFRVDNKWHYAAVSDGFAQILPKKVVLLADTVELPEEIDIKRANEAKLRAEEKLRQKQSILEYYQTQASLNRAMNRLRVTQRHPYYK